MAQVAQGSAGTYYLSKSPTSKVSRLAQPRTENPNRKLINVIAHADRGNGDRLNFAASATSKDTFVVQKDNTEHLLTRITSRAEDRSTEIADKIVQTVFKGLEAAAADPFRSGTEVGPPQLAKAFEGEYDPFNEHEARLFNEGLKDIGFRLYLDDGSRGRRPPIGAYCDNPLARRAGSRSCRKRAPTPHGRRWRKMPSSAPKAFCIGRGSPIPLYLFQNRRPGLELPGNLGAAADRDGPPREQIPDTGGGDRPHLLLERKTTLAFCHGRAAGRSRREGQRAGQRGDHPAENCELPGKAAVEHHQLGGCHQPAREPDPRPGPAHRRRAQARALPGRLCNRAGGCRQGEGQHWEHHWRNRSIAGALASR